MRIVIQYKRIACAVEGKHSKRDRRSRTVVIRGYPTSTDYDFHGFFERTQKHATSIRIQLSVPFSFCYAITVYTILIHCRITICIFFRVRKWFMNEIVITLLS